MVLFKSKYKCKHLKMYKNKKKDISYILKKPSKLTSTCAIHFVGNTNWQIFFSSDYSTPNLLPQNPAILKTTVNILEKKTKTKPPHTKCP